MAGSVQWLLCDLVDSGAGVLNPNWHECRRRGRRVSVAIPSNQVTVFDRLLLIRLDCNGFGVAIPSNQVTVFDEELLDTAHYGFHLVAIPSNQVTVFDGGLTSRMLRLNHGCRNPF